MDGRLREVGILSSNLRAARSEFGIDERSGECDGSSRSPCAEDEKRRVDLLSDDVGIDEDAGANDASHHEHHRVEQAQAAKEGRHQFI